MSDDHDRPDALIARAPSADDPVTAADRPDAFTHIASELVGVLAMHNRKEELILYPWMDPEFTPDETAQALRRMSAG